MNQSVVAVFENRAEAEQAREEVIASGVAPQYVTLQASDGSTDTELRTAPGTQIDTETGIGHFFRSLFGMEDDLPGRYEEAVRRGHATLVIDCQDEDEIDRIRAILDRHDVVDIDERATTWGADIQGDRAATGGPGATAAGRNAGQDVEARIPVVEENLAVGKREVERGGIRVYTRVLERPVEESVQLREERARVSRQPVDRPATEADLSAAFKEGSIEVRERAEVPVVEKQARVVEEVHVGKEVRERTETVRDKVHKTDVQVEEAAPAAAESGKARRTDKPRRR